VQVRVTVAEVTVEDRTTFGELRLQGAPAFWLKAIVFANPLTAVTRIVEAPAEPTSTIKLVGLVETL